MFVAEKTPSTCFQIEKGGRFWTHPEPSGCENTEAVGMCDEKGIRSKFADLRDDMNKKGTPHIITHQSLFSSELPFSSLAERLPKASLGKSRHLLIYTTLHMVNRPRVL